MTDGFLSRRLLVDGFKWQGDFDEFFAVGHEFSYSDSGLDFAERFSSGHIFSITAQPSSVACIP